MNSNLNNKILYQILRQNHILLLKTISHPIHKLKSKFIKTIDN